VDGESGEPYLLRYLGCTSPFAATAPVRLPVPCCAMLRLHISCCCLMLPCLLQEQLLAREPKAPEFTFRVKQATYSGRQL
jgi:hypothetical protein